MFETADAPSVTHWKTTETTDADEPDGCPDLSIAHTKIAACADPMVSKRPAQGEVTSN